MGVDKTIKALLDDSLELAEALSDDIQELSEELQQYEDIKLMAEELCDSLTRLRARLEE